MGTNEVNLYAGEGTEQRKWHTVQYWPRHHPTWCCKGSLFCQHTSGINLMGKFNKKEELVQGVSHPKVFVSSAAKDVKDQNLLSSSPFMQLCHSLLQLTCAHCPTILHAEYPTAYTSGEGHKVANPQHHVHYVHVHAPTYTYAKACYIQ